MKIAHINRLMTRPTMWPVCPAKTQISLGIRPVWSESSLSAWRKLGSLATLWAHSKDWSDWVDAQADLSLRWAHMSFCWFCHEAAHIKLKTYCHDRLLNSQNCCKHLVLNLSHMYQKMKRKLHDFLSLGCLMEWNNSHHKMRHLHFHAVSRLLYHNINMMMQLQRYQYWAAACVWQPTRRTCVQNLSTFCECG